MLIKAGYLLLVIAVLQASAVYVEPEFIEDVIERQLESRSVERIVSGWEAQLGQHPHQASLRMVDGTGSVTACGGSFVHREWLVTSAHCTATRITLVVRGGLVELLRPEYIWETTEWWNHPSYDSSQPALVQLNDISIVKLQRPVTYTRNLQPIRVQSRADAYKNYEGEVLHTSGYGRTWTLGSTSEVLRWVYLRGVSNPSCGSIFGQFINENSICAQWFNVTSQSVCQGDSGGPLVYVNGEGEKTLIGVTSFVAGGEWGCHSGLPAGFIRPGPFLDWFEDVSGIDFETLQEDDEDEVTEAPPSEDSSEEDVSGEDSSDEDSSVESSESDEDDDCDMSQLMKSLKIKVKVKVSINKKIKKKVKKEIEKERRKHDMKLL